MLIYRSLESTQEPNYVSEEEEEEEEEKVGRCHRAKRERELAIVVERMQFAHTSQGRDKQGNQRTPIVSTCPPRLQKVPTGLLTRRREKHQTFPFEKTTNFRKRARCIQTSFRSTIPLNFDGGMYSI
jgi:hypothetical protein